MSANQRRLDPSARVLAAASTLAVLFGIVVVVADFGGTALKTVAILSLIVGVVALLLAVGKYISD